MSASVRDIVMPTARCYVSPNLIVRYADTEQLLLQRGRRWLLDYVEEEITQLAVINAS